MERKPPRLYIVLQFGIKMTQPQNGVLLFTKDETVFRMNPEKMGFGELRVNLPKLQKYETCKLKIQRSPNDIVVLLVRENIPIWRMASEGLPWIGLTAFELPMGYTFAGNEVASKAIVLSFIDPDKPDSPALYIRKDMVHAILDVSNGETLDIWR